VRAAEEILTGSFVCEYTGEVVSDQYAETHLRTGDRDSYLFDLPPVLPGGASGVDLNEGAEVDFVVDAYRAGSVARFVNHECGKDGIGGNLVMQNVFVESARMPRLCLFATVRKEDFFCFLSLRSGTARSGG
jgi:euchromatic histone-lysine N-methyltransferase